MIPQETIDQIRQVTDIVQIIGEYVRLKKRGRNHLALCPFHTEKTPSFSVSPDKQIFYCFGCGKGGNVFSFLMEHEKMSFVEAVRHLARKSNITIPEESGSPQRRERLERLGYANQTALEYFKQQLFSSRYLNVLDGYLRDRRKITDESIEAFQLGLAGQEWQGLIEYTSTKGFSAEELVDFGLAIKSEKRNDYFDRFRQRLMIPIFNLSGKPIAFGGRALAKGDAAKYINSPETSLYVKGHVLFGLETTKGPIRDAKFAYVVEGYFDLISLWQVGVKNVVASSGTAFTLQQARLLARFANEVYLFFDADSAGRKAAIRSVDVLYDAGLEVKVIDAPPGEDPDSIARESGVDGIERLREAASGFIPFRIKDVNLTEAGIIGREKLVKEMRTLGANIADPTRRALFYAEAADALQVDPLLLTSRDAGKKTDSSATATPPAEKRFNPQEVHLLSLLFNQRGSISGVLEVVSPKDFDSKQLARLYSAMITQYRAVGSIDAGVLVENLGDDTLISLATELASIEFDPEQVDSQTSAAVKAIAEGKSKRRRDQLRKELVAAEAEGDQDKADKIIAELRRTGLDAR